jgi:hypothetical protein
MGTERRRQGAVMVEAIVVLSTMVLMLALILFVHNLASTDIQAAQTARSQAWTAAMNGCGEGGFDFKSMLRGLKSGELPIPDSFIPSHTAEGAAQGSVQRAFGRGLRRVAHTVKIPCSSKHTATEGDVSGDWLMSLID